MKIEELQEMARRSNWSVILYAYGEYERVDGFSTKQDAVDYAQIQIDTSSPAIKVSAGEYEIDGRHLVMKTSDAENMFDDRDAIRWRER